MVLANKAILLRRSDWIGTRELAEELEAILLTDVPDSTGPIAVNIVADDRPDEQYAATAVQRISIPTFDFDSPSSTSGFVNAATVTELDNGDGSITQIAETIYTQRQRMLGRIAVFNDPDYDIDIFPDGPDGSAIRILGVLELNGKTIDTGLWSNDIYIIGKFRIREFTTLTREERSVISKSAEVTLVNREHFIVIPVAGAAVELVQAPWGSGANYDQPPAVTRVLQWIVTGVRHFDNGGAPHTWQVANQTQNLNWAPNTTLVFSPTFPFDSSSHPYHFHAPTGTVVANPTSSEIELTVSDLQDNIGATVPSVQITEDIVTFADGTLMQHPPSATPRANGSYTDQSPFNFWRQSAPQPGDAFGHSFFCMWRLSFTS